PAPSPRKAMSLAPSGRVFWLGDHPPPVPSRPVAVAATGLVPPHSCGAAGDSHPLPASDEVGRVGSAGRGRRQALPTIAQSGSGPCRVPLASDESVIGDLLLALGLGLLVGFQRQAVHEPVAGIRTFALVTLLGCLCGLMVPALGVWIVPA